MFPHFLRSRKLPLLVGLIALFSFASSLANAGTVAVRPGANLVSLVNSNPAGTTFIIYPGTYRLTALIAPKTGDKFVGQTACAPPKTACPAILSGSRLLTSFQYSGSYYYVSGQTQQGQIFITTTQCISGYPGCIYPEDLFFDGQPLVHVAELSQVVSGTWYFDYATQTIYFSDNPSGHTVETSVTPAAFQSNADNVTIQDLTIEEFAAPITAGAVGIYGGSASTTAGANWIIENNEILLNHGDGVRVNFGYQILNNYIHDNGNLGIGGGTLIGAIIAAPEPLPSNILIQGNEIAYNNYAEVKPAFGAGGVKIGNTRGVQLIGNYIHDNLGSGFHADTDNIDTLADGNTINDNTEEGLFNEISYAATFRNNTLRRNGYTHANHNEWMYGANILSSSSQNVTAYCNTVEVSAEGGNGMNIIAQGRTGYTSANNYFHHNTVIFDGDSGWNGGANADPTETQAQFFTSNRFDYNRYHLPGMIQKAFPWQKALNDFPNFQTAGAEPHGTADTDYKVGAPVVSITQPVTGAEASGTMSMTGTATDSMAISKVEFYVDWVLQTTAGGVSPFKFDWDTSGVAAGSHVLAAMAYNTDGIRSCYAITVTVP